MNASVSFAGGRAAALAALARIRPARYGGSRNFLDGAVSRLSPYLRHGILSLAEVRDAALGAAKPSEVYKFVQELAWRDYYVRVRRVAGDRVWDDAEAYKTGFRAAAYASDLPPDVADAATGAACIDSFTTELIETGYLHNHARMWYAAYVVHWRRVRWQAGAAFFLRHLLDGDPASNNLSWQWIASTFSHKPYIFDRANLERYTRGAYCARCPLANGGCPFDASYAQLDARLFPGGTRAVEAREPLALHVPADTAPVPAPPVADAVVWLHDESLSPGDAAAAAAPEAPAIFVWDGEARRRDPWSPQRERFVAETLTELEPGRIATGDAVAEIAAFAREHEARTVVTTAAVDPRLRQIAAALRATFDVVETEPPRFVTLDRAVDLRRFSRYWQRAQTTAFAPTPAVQMGMPLP